MIVRVFVREGVYQWLYDSSQCNLCISPFIKILSAKREPFRGMYEELRVSLRVKQREGEIRVCNGGLRDGNYLKKKKRNVKKWNRTRQISDILSNSPTTL